jgi:hypothetical protein
MYVSFVVKSSNKRFGARHQVFDASLALELSTCWMCNFVIRLLTARRNMSYKENGLPLFPRIDLVAVGLNILKYQDSKLRVMRQSMELASKLASLGCSVLLGCSLWLSAEALRSSASAGPSSGEPFYLSNSVALRSLSGMSSETSRRLVRFRARQIGVQQKVLPGPRI